MSFAADAVHVLHASNCTPYSLLGPPTSRKPPTLHISSSSSSFSITSQPDKHALAYHPRARDRAKCGWIERRLRERESKGMQGTQDMEGKESKEERRGCSTRNGVHPAGAYTDLMTNSKSGIRMGEWTGGQCLEPNQDILSSLEIFYGLNSMAVASIALVAMATIRRPAHREREARTLLEAFSRPTHFRGLYDLKQRITSRCSSR
jgi:hypothetical protein